MSNISEALKVHSPEDIAALRAEIPVLSSFRDFDVQALYKSFSRDFCASWLIVAPNTIKQFTEWLAIL